MSTKDWICSDAPLALECVQRPSRWPPWEWEGAFAIGSRLAVCGSRLGHSARAWPAVKLPSTMNALGWVDQSTRKPLVRLCELSFACTPGAMSDVSLPVHCEYTRY